MPTVGEFIVDSLVANGVDRVFCVPGESYLGLLDALYGRNDIDTVVCRHEAGAGFMALADARLTGRAGVACVSRGPGASNAAIAVHTAQQDGVPFLLLIGQVAARDVRRDSFQEIDYGHMFGSIAKWTAEVTDPHRVAETMLRAIQVATSGTPGPVVVSLPEDVLLARIDQQPITRQAPIKSAPDPADVRTLQRWLAQARQPLVIAGPASTVRADARRCAPSSRAGTFRRSSPSAVRICSPTPIAFMPATWGCRTRRARWRCSGKPTSRSSSARA